MTPQLHLSWRASIQERANRLRSLLAAAAPEPCDSPTGSEPPSPPRPGTTEREALVSSRETKSWRAWGATGAGGEHERKELRDAIEEAEGKSELPARLAESAYSGAQERLNERLVTIATQHQLNPDDFSEQVLTMLTERYYVEQIHDCTLAKLIQTVLEEQKV